MTRTRSSVLTRTCSGLWPGCWASAPPSVPPSSLSPSGSIFPRRSVEPTPSRSAAPTAKTIPTTTMRKMAPAPTRGAYPLLCRPNERRRRRRSAASGLLQRDGGRDVREVRERLGIVAQQLPARGVHLLGEEPDRAGGGHGLLEDLAGLLQAALARVALRQPERAGQKGALLAAESVVAPVA